MFFWNMTQCWSLVGGYQYFGGRNCLHIDKYIFPKHWWPPFSLHTMWISPEDHNEFSLPRKHLIFVLQFLLSKSVLVISYILFQIFVFSYPKKWISFGHTVFRYFKIGWGYSWIMDLSNFIVTNILGWQTNENS